MAQNPASLREFLGEDRIDQVDLLVEARQEPGDVYSIERLLLSALDQELASSADEIELASNRRDEAEAERRDVETRSFEESERQRKALIGGLNGW